MKMPEFLYQYFWDVNAKELTTEHDGRFVMERILEKGNEQAVAWLNETFSRTDLEAVVRESRRLSPKSRNYWGLLYNLWSTENPSARMRGGIWQR